MKEKDRDSIVLSDGPPPVDAGLFGLSCSYQESLLVILPVSWDATASYGKGASSGPRGICQASHQLDLEDSFFDRPYEHGIFLLPESNLIKELNEKANEDVDSIRDKSLDDKLLNEAYSRVNDASGRVNEWVERECDQHLNQSKLVGLLGGDHSSPYGYLRSLSKRRKDFGILHFDAHFDLRQSYEGFEHSHASIMYNVLNSCPSVSKLVQVGIRDFCKQESEHATTQGDRVEVFYDADLFRQKASGLAFAKIVDKMIHGLPEQVYISFDIDGLSPNYCPGTGTPVPGGLSFYEALYIIERLVESRRQIIGFDLCEVSQGMRKDDWDFNVGARVLYKLCGAMMSGAS